MIQQRVVNNVKVQAIPLPKHNTENIRGWKMFPSLYPNIFLVGRKKSGKSNIIYNILKKCASKSTKIILFCSTCLRDDGWVEALHRLEDRGYQIEKHTSTVEDGVNLIQEFLERSTEDEDVDLEDKKRSNKRRKISPEYIMIFDDLAHEIRNSKALSLLYKTNRHYKMMTLTSSQYALDLPPMSRKQMDYWLIFSGQNQEKLQSIYRDADISVTMERFDALYNVATREPYHFMYIDTRTDAFRKNFNTEIK